METNKYFDEMVEAGYMPIPPHSCPYRISTCSTCMHAAYPRQLSEADRAGNPLWENMDKNRTCFCTYRTFHIPEDMEELKKFLKMES